MVDEDLINVYYVLNDDVSVEEMEKGKSVRDLKIKLYGNLLGVELNKITFYTDKDKNDKFKLKSVDILVANSVDKPLYIDDKRNVINAIYSPRLRGSVYVLAYIPPNAFPRLLGTAWAVESQSQQLLLTALHCLDPELNQISFEALQNHLYIAKSIQLNDDNTTTIDVPISVRAIDACRVSDVAVLRSTTPLPDPISLCPQQELPSVDHEEAVKTYHVPCQSFPADIPIASAMATDYTKIIMQSNHHYFVPGEHMHGSSGGVVVDRRGRAVGLISSGFVPGIKLPLPDSFKTLWETVSALSEGRGTYTRCVKVNVVNGLYEYCASH